MKALFASVVLALLPAAMFPADSPSFRSGSGQPGVQRLMTAGGIYASPVLSGGVVYIASTDGSVYALI